MEADRPTGRSEVLTEYYKVIDMLQVYDAHFLTIKNWSVGLSAGAIGFAFVRDAAPGFLLAALLAAGFWMSDVHFKLLQLGHIRRAGQIEAALAAGRLIPSPEIMKSYGIQRAEDQQRQRWLAVAFWPHVMLPHLVFVLLSLGVAAYLLLAR